MGTRGPKTDKPWADAIRKAVNDIYEEKTADGKIKKTKHINRLAENLVRKAAEGDVTALKEVGDRLDGRPAQMLQGDEKHPLEIIIKDGWARDRTPS